MKPAPFAYADPDTLEGALDLLARAPDAKVLAGGQSLMPLLNMRLARPPLLVDIGRIASLRGIEAAEDGGLVLGAGVTHKRLAHDPAVRERWPLLAQAASLIGHEAIRARGTLGGSLVHSDPAAELPAAAVAADAVLVLESRDGGRREVAARDFFITYLTTDVAPGEVLTAVRLPAPPPGAGMAFEEVARRSGDFALAGAAAVVALDASGAVREARLALCGVGGTPVRAAEAEAVLAGRRLDEAALEAAAEAVRQAVEPEDDLHATAAYRRHLAGVLAVRALRRAGERASGGGEG
ncbi:MAG: xanthine dehydrogenase family protein subunit M [Firmicutes bacterium]|nr:xanthine dehydrogenase family protein subunit M [Bacillota bacterium]